MIPSPLNENPIISTTGGILKEYPQSPLLLFNSKSRVDVVVETINCIYTDPDIENKMNTTSKFNWFLEVLAATSYLGKESSPFKISTLKLYSKWLLTDVKPQPLKNNFEEYADYILYCLINYFNLKDDDHDVQPTNCYHSLHIIDNVIHETQIETVRLSCIRSLILIIDLLTESCPFESMFGRVLNVLHQAIMLCNVSDATMELFFLRSKSWGHNLDAARQWFSTCVALQTGYISYLEQKTDDVIVNFLMKNGETTPLILEPKRALQMWLDFLKLANFTSENTDVVSTYVEGFSSLIHLMVDLSFDETYKFEKPDGNAIFMLYGNFLFHVITRAESKLCYDAVASAVAGLSSFFASMITKTTFDIKYVSYLTVALNRTLRSENNNIVYSCISHINKLLLYPIGPISLILEPLLKSINHLVECGFPTTPVIYGVLIKTLQDSLLPFSITQKLQFIPLYNSIIRRLVNRDLLSPDNFPALFQFIENYLAISLPIKQTSSTLNLASIKNSNITDCPTIHHIVWALLFDSNILLDVSFRNSKEKPIRAIVSLFRIIKNNLGFVLESTEFVLKTVDLFFEFLTNFVNSDKIISIALIVEVLHLTMGYSLLIQNQDITQRLVTILIKLHFNKNIDVRYVDFFASTFINHLCSHQLTTESEVLEKLKESGVEDPMKYLHVGVFNESIISFIDHPYKTDAHYTTVIIRHLYGKRVFSFKTSNNAHVCSFTQFSPCYESFQQRLRWVIQNVSSSFFDYSSDISLDNYASMEEKNSIKGDHTKTILLPTEPNFFVLPPSNNPQIAGRILHANLQAWGTKHCFYTTQDLINDLGKLDYTPSKLRLYIHIEYTKTPSNFFISFIKNLGICNVVDDQKVFISSDFRSEMIFDCPQLTNSTQRKEYDIYIKWKDIQETVDVDSIAPNTIIIKPLCGGSFSFTQNCNNETIQQYFPSYALPSAVRTSIILPYLHQEDAFLQPVLTRQIEIERIVNSNREMYSLEWSLFLSPVVDKATKFNWTPIVTRKDLKSPTFRKSENALPPSLMNKVEQRRSSSKIDRFIENNEEKATILLKNPHIEKSSRENSCVDAPDNIITTHPENSNASGSKEKPLVRQSFFSKPENSKFRKSVIGSKRKTVAFSSNPLANSLPPQSMQQNKQNENDGNDDTNSATRKTFAFSPTQTNFQKQLQKDLQKGVHKNLNKTTPLHASANAQIGISKSPPLKHKTVKHEQRINPAEMLKQAQLLKKAKSQSLTDSSTESQDDHSESPRVEKQITPPIKSAPLINEKDVNNEQSHPKEIEFVIKTRQLDTSQNSNQTISSTQPQIQRKVFPKKLSTSVTNTVDGSFRDKLMAFNNLSNSEQSNPSLHSDTPSVQNKSKPLTAISTKEPIDSTESSENEAPSPTIQPKPYRTPTSKSPQNKPNHLRQTFSGGRKATIKFRKPE